MITLVKNILKSIVPKLWWEKTVSLIEHRRHYQYLEKLRSSILQFLKDKQNRTSEESEVLTYLTSHPISVFPYDFQSKYDKSSIEVLHDDHNSLPYVMHEGKRLYFKRSYTDAKIRSLYHGLQLDQDPDSPHLYLTTEFNLDANDVIADIGAAEGNFSLSNVERVKRIYLFESDQEWIEALEATFNPWKDKVTICHKFVSNSNTGQAISLDKFAEDHPDITFVKVDIEGEEARFLDGSKGFLQSKNAFKMAICTYHKQQDEVEFTRLLESYGLQVEPSKRYMIFYHDHTIGKPYLRRALLRAEKKQQ